MYNSFLFTVVLLSLILHLYPMSFLEFVLAVKGEQLFSILKEGTFDDISIFHPTFVELLRQYYFCGGMPEAVLAFVEGKSVAEIITIQESILYSYQKDIAKHPHKNEIPKIHQVWSAIPNQLAKENKKFIYGALKKGARAKDFENAVFNRNALKQHLNVPPTEEELAQYAENAKQAAAKAAEAAKQAETASGNDKKEEK